MGYLGKWQNRRLAPLPPKGRCPLQEISDPLRTRFKIGQKAANMKKMNELALADVVLGGGVTKCSRFQGVFFLNFCRAALPQGRWRPFEKFWIRPCLAIKNYAKEVADNKFHHYCN